MLFFVVGVVFVVLIFVGIVVGCWCMVEDEWECWYGCW